MYYSQPKDMTEDQFSMTPLWVLSIPDLSPGAKILYGRLRTHMGNNAMGWAMVSTLALELGTSSRQILRWTQELESYGKADCNKGLIEVIRNGPGKGVNSYITPPHPSAQKFIDRFNKARKNNNIAESDRLSDESDRLSDESDNLVVVNVTTCPLESDRLSHKYNHRKEPSEKNQEKNQEPVGSLRSPTEATPRGEIFLAIPGSREQEKVTVIGSTQGITRRIPRRASAGTNTANKPQLRELESVWCEEFRKAFPNTSISAWAGKEFGTAVQFLRRFSFEDTVTIIRFAFAHWNSVFRVQFKKAPEVPSMPFLFSIRQEVISRAYNLGRSLQAKTKYDQWKSHNIGSFARPPTDLQKAYTEALPILKSYGVA